MRTETLIHVLAQEAGPARSRAVGRGFALVLAVGTPLAFAVLLGWLGLNAALAEYTRLPMFWVKLAFGLTMGGAGLWLALLLARPGVRAGVARFAPLMPPTVLWLLAALALAAAAPGERLDLVLGSSWRVCPTNIAILSVPFLVGSLLALRTMAPTRPALAGAAAGLFAGGFGAAVYALHCPELAPPFLALWYVLGVAICVGAGALIGSRLLRW